MFRKFLYWLMPERPPYTIPDMLAEQSQRVAIYKEVNERLTFVLGRPPTTTELYQAVFRFKESKNVQT